MKKITLILIALITVGCSEPKDKYISLQCTDKGISIGLILNKETMTFDHYLLSESDLDGPFSGQFREYGENYYLLIGDKAAYLDRRTLMLMPVIGAEDEIQCKKIDLPKNQI